MWGSELLREKPEEMLLFKKSWNEDQIIRGVCSGRECRNPAGESPATPVARFRRVAIPQFMLGNRMLIAWCKRLSCPVDLVLQR